MNRLHRKEERRGTKRAIENKRGRDRERKKKSSHVEKERQRKEKRITKRKRDRNGERERALVTVLQKSSSRERYSWSTARDHCCANTDVKKRSRAAAIWSASWSNSPRRVSSTSSEPELILRSFSGPRCGARLIIDRESRVREDANSEIRLHEILTHFLSFFLSLFLSMSLAE